MSAKPPLADLIADLAEQLGVPAFVAVCTDLLRGADREAYVAELRSLTGHDYWVRTWGARGLLHEWGDSATAAPSTATVIDNRGGGEPLTRRGLACPRPFATARRASMTI